MLAVKRKLEVGWLSELDSFAFQKVLCEYRYLVHRFTPWLGLIISKTDEERVRQLLLPNFVEESGSIGGTISHLKMLDNFLLSCGIQRPDEYRALQSTIETEQWFYNLFDSGNTYASLCAIGPSTEEISGQFLQPMLEATKIIFGESKVDFTYFDAHLSEMEVEHVRCIQEAIDFMEGKNPLLKNDSEKWINESIRRHSFFWDSLKEIYCR